MTIRAAVLASAFLVAGQFHALAQSPGASSSAPYAMMRTLQILQEQVAHGDVAAQAAQPELMRHIADRFLAAEPAVWREPRNARAAALFLLSGGKGSVIRAILEKGVFPAETDRLMKGALAYAEGRDDIAATLLTPIDARALPAMLGAHLALVQASLLAEKDVPAAEKLLDLARLLAPGTLVEEAALRRQVFLLADKDTLDKFVSLSRQYVRRFRKSVYAENFKQRFTSAATRLALMGDVNQLAKLEPVIGDLSIEEQRAFYLTIGRAAILQGKTDAVRFSAAKAAASAPEASLDAARAKLYLGAALIVSDEIVKGMAMLQASEPSRLAAADVEVRDAAMTVARSVLADLPSPDKVEGPDAPPGIRAGIAGFALVERANKALEQSDRLLRGDRS